MKNVLVVFCCIIVFSSCIKIKLPPKPVDYSDQAAGKSASDLLSASKYTTLHIQVQYMPGYKLDTTTLNNAVYFLNNLCHKPNGIKVTQSQIEASGFDTLTFDQVKAIEEKYRTEYTDGDTICIYILVTDGYDGSEKSITIAGVAYLNTSIALYGKVLRYGNVLDSGNTFVLDHELGHLMGLVNVGSSMQTPHQDMDHGNHCSNPMCLMHWDGKGLLQLDSNCLNDLRANGGK